MVLAQNPDVVVASVSVVLEFFELLVVVGIFPLSLQKALYFEQFWRYLAIPAIYIPDFRQIG